MVFLRSLFVLSIIISFSLDLYAQNNLVTNGSFEDNVINDFQAVCYGYVMGWSASPGTPDYAMEYIDCPPPSSVNGAEVIACFNHFINMWSKNNDDSEGMFQLIDFEVAINYRIEVRAKTPDSRATFIIALTNDLVPKDMDLCSGGGTIPSQPEVLEVAQTTITNKEWQSFSFETGGLLNDYNNLWIYANNIDANNGQQNIYIDDVSVSIECIDDKYYQNTNQLPTITKTSDFIIAGNEVTTGAIGVVTVQSGQNVIFEAINQIKLKPGFYANEGSNFLAAIIGCDDTNYSTVTVSNGRMSSNNSQPTYPHHVIDSAINITNSSFLRNIYPNPTKDVLNIQYSINQALEINFFIIDAAGKTVLDFDVIRHVEAGLYIKQFDLSSLKQGIYFLHYQSQSEHGSFKLGIE